MDIEPSGSGFFILTFINKQKLNYSGVKKIFTAAGKVCGISTVKNRVFVRYEHKHEAIKAIELYGKSLHLEVARNKTRAKKKPSGENQEEIAQEEMVEEQMTHEQPPEEVPPQEVEVEEQQPSTSQATQDIASCSEGCSLSEDYHLILGNIPEKYTIEEVRGLVAEAHPLAINNVEETRATRKTFWHVVLDSEDELNYLIDKLNGFVIHGKEIMAFETKTPSKWK